LSPGTESADATTSLNRALAGQAESMPKSKKLGAASIMQNKKSPPFLRLLDALWVNSGRRNLRRWVTNILLGKDMTQQLRQ